MEASEVWREASIAGQAAFNEKYDEIEDSTAYVKASEHGNVAATAVIERALAEARIAALEEAAGVMARRAAMYRAKASKRDPFADDDRNAYDTFVMCAEASEYGEADIRALKEKNDG